MTRALRCAKTTACPLQVVTEAIAGGSTLAASYTAGRKSHDCFERISLASLQLVVIVNTF
jgi:hypothetical protein